jgi:hypothetical protein
MPTLNWIGKQKVVNHHLEVRLRTLVRTKTHGDPGLHEANKVIHGDNLEALKALLPEYEGRVKCIYIDPPYNTGNEGWVYNDNVNDPRIKRWPAGRQRLLPAPRRSRLGRSGRRHSARGGRKGPILRGLRRQLPAAPRPSWSATASTSASCRATCHGCKL